jgi:hypothetical protein
MVLFPGSSQPGKSGNSRFDERQNRLRVIDKVSRSEALPNQPTGILTTNSKLSNIFLHILQAIDLVGEKRHGEGIQLWKYEPIKAFVGWL